MGCSFVRPWLDLKHWFMKYLPIYFLLLSLLESCGERKIREGLIEETNFTQIQVDSPAASEPITAIIDSLELINLEDHENAVLSEAASISRILYFDKKLFVLDNRYMSIKVFDLHGKYLYALGDLGIGRGEFTNIQDIVLDQKHASILALCNTPSKLITFSSTGEVLDEKSLPFFASNVVIASNGDKLYYVNQNNSPLSQHKNILLTSPDDELESRLFDFPKNVNGMLRFTAGLYPSGGKIYFNPPLSNKFYEMAGDTAKAGFEVNFGSHNLPSNPSITDLFGKQKSYSFPLNGFLCDDDYVGFSYFESGYHTAFLNRHTHVIYKSSNVSDSLNKLFCNAMYECAGKKVMILDCKKLSPFIHRNLAAIKESYPNVHQKLVTDTMHKNLSLLMFTTKKIRLNHTIP